mgnify:FL=1|tara:strand:+ start:965 stop:1336 length:372 start_codon:yes stop_codon:yes gene_type:complete
MMKVFDELTNKNFEFFAMQNYNNTECCDVEEFKEDLARFKYLKRLFRRYEVHNDLQERLILNHLIVIYNIFGIEAANRMTWFKVDEEHYQYLKPFLVFLNYLDIRERVEITMDQNIIKVLRNV